MKKVRASVTVGEASEEIREGLDQKVSAVCSGRLVIAFLSNVTSEPRRVD